MGYIDKSLMDGEHIVYRTRIHWAIFLGPIILFAISLILASGASEGAKALFGFLFFIPAIWLISAAISRRTAEFGITNKRVLIKTGFIKRNSVETLLLKVEGIEVNQGILGRILNFGTVVIRGTGGSYNPFKKIADPIEFRKIAQEQINKAQSGVFSPPPPINP